MSLNTNHLNMEENPKIEHDTELMQLYNRQEYWDVFIKNGEVISESDLQDYVKTIGKEQIETLFKFGLSCFVHFVQNNFTGPAQKTCLEGPAKDLDFRAMLSLNSEEVNINTLTPELLVVAKLAFSCCQVNKLVNIWWGLRALIIHQELMEETSTLLLADAERLIRNIELEPLSDSVKVEIQLEIVQLYIKFRHISKAKGLLARVYELAGVDYEFIGVLGKRTRHQDFDLAQMAVKISVKEPCDCGTDESCKRCNQEEVTPLPNNLAIDDEVRLNRVQYNEPTINPKLTITEQKLLLARMQYEVMALPSDQLEHERIIPVIEAVLDQPNTWCIRVTALMLRTTLECKERRTIERCLKQCESVLDHFELEQPARVGDVFSTGLPAKFRNMATHANILLAVGLVRNALDLFLQIEDWEKVIVCYHLLEQKHKAEEVIRQRLEVKPTVKLHCYLGDVTENERCYEVAWQLSKSRSHRAQKHWAMFLFDRKEYQRSLEHFEKSLSINPLQTQLWFLLGYAAQETKNWPKAATAYRRYTTLAPESFEAWNNLAQAYLHTGNQRSAHQALLEALKYNHENWKLWENLLLVSCDLLVFTDVIRAYHRLLDLREKYVNENVLTFLVCHVRDDEQPKTTSKDFLIKNTRELMGRITAAHPTNGFVWDLYSLVAPTMEVALLRLQKAYRGYTSQQTGGWEKCLRKSKDVLDVCDKMMDVILMEPEKSKIRSKDIAEVRLMVSSCLATVKKMNWDKTKSQVESMEDRLEKITDMIKKA